MKTWGPFDRKPNLLIICTDQQRSLQHFPPGWAEKHLPWLTHLQKTGVTFDRGMCSSTACSPSRSALFTGTYPTINGVLKVNDTLSMSRTLPMGGSLTTLGQVLTGGGYQLAYKGKWHLDGSFAAFSNMRPADLDRMMIEDDAMENHYSFPDWTSPDQGTAEVNSAATAGDISPLNSLGGGTVDNDSRIVNGPLYDPRQKSASQFLREYDPADEPPFCLIVSMANPHDVWVLPESLSEAGYQDEVWLGSDYDGFALPASYFQNLRHKPTAQQNFLQRFQDGPLSREDAESYVRFYAYLQTLVDALTGDLIQALRENQHVGQALENDTLVVRIADHGEMAMAQGGLRQKENNCYNESIRVPIIFSNPQLPQGKNVDSLVGLIDMMPTLAEITGAEIDPGFAIQGQSFAGSILDPGRPGRKQFLFATDDCGLTQYTSIRTLVRDDCKYAVYYKADYDSSENPIVNYNGEVDTDTTVEYEFYDYSTAGGLEETDNLLSDPDGVDDQLWQRWQELHEALTRLVTESFTCPNNWSATGPTNSEETES